ncbi:MAG: hypothetical protein J5I93_00955, partial [Pirellulaceae bacterium]|nr:hypothetical protein [Pirellulaceae bacterium]
ETFEVLVSTLVAGTPAGVLSFGNNDANESPFNFNITADVLTSLKVDNSSASGFTHTAGFGLYGGQGFLNSVRAEFSPNGGDTATWTFPALPSGMYRVSATWSHEPNRATNAPFAISSTVGGGMTGPILIDQKLAPGNASSPVGTSILDSGKTFADLVTVFNHTGGDLVVTLTDASVNGWIIADAIRVAAPGMLQIAAPEASAGGTVLSDAAILPVVRRAIDYWTQIDTSHAARLQGVEVYVRDLPAGVLGLGSFAAPQIWLDDDASGHGWQLDVRQPTGGVDLLTVITHELGHVLGLPDLDPRTHQGDIMSGRLTLGERRVAAGDWRAAGENLLAAPLGSAAAQPLVADQLYGWLAAREWSGRELSASGLVPSRGARQSEVSADETLPTLVERRVEELIEPLVDERRRRRELTATETAADDYFAELGSTDESQQ